MALATRCPHCHTTFRVAQDQLKLRAGLVRCGACKQIFNGIEHLVPPANEAPPVLPAATQPPPPPGVLDPGQAIAKAGDQAAADAAAAPTPAPAAPIGNKDENEAPHAPAQAGSDQVEPDPLLRMTLLDFADARRDTPNIAAGDAVDAQVPDAPDVPDPLDRAMEELEQKPLRGLTRPSAHVEVEADDIDDGLDDAYEPSFVRQGRRRQRFGRALRIGMWAGSAVLLFALIAQAAYLFRDRIAASMPQMKPALAHACALLGCRVGLPAQIEAVSLESSELQALSPEKNTFALTALLRNRSAIPQEWPAIELTLNDANDKPIARRVFMPRDYLPSSQDLSKGFAAGSEQPIKLSFELSQLTASGYRVYLFYP